MFNYLQSRIHGTATTGDVAPPPGLIAFYWHFVRQTKQWYAAMFATSLAVALIDTVIPVFIGSLVSLMQVADRHAALAQWMPMLVGMVLLVLIVRPLVLLLDIAIRQNALVPGATSLIRWQSHWHVMRQNWAFFQNDFAGRIANRVMQTAQALRESVMSSIRAFWYITVYGVTAFALMARSDWRLGLPTLLWFLGYVVFLRHFVPRMRTLSMASSEVRSIVVARIVDSYTNILTVKLFARPSDEDAYVREVIDEHQAAIAAHMRLISYFMFWLAAMNAVLLTATAAVGIWLWAQGTVSAGVVATALPLAWQIANMAGWVSWEATGIFENITASCSEGMQIAGCPAQGWPRPGRMRRRSARCRAVRSVSRTCRFSTMAASMPKPVLDRLSFTDPLPANGSGLVEYARARGKSTLVHLLLRFCRRAGAVGARSSSMARTSEASPRKACAPRSAWVTQDTSLTASLDRRQHRASRISGVSERRREAVLRRQREGYAGPRIHRRTAG